MGKRRGGMGGEGREEGWGERGDEEDGGERRVQEGSPPWGERIALAGP